MDVREIGKKEKRKEEMTMMEREASETKKRWRRRRG